jgi:ABC-type sugar transport system ATPase subunit
VSLSKAFDDNLAVDSISLDIFSRQILAVVGANGSGKTTLMRLVSGSLSPDSGEFWYRESRVRFASAADARARGIRMLPQAPELYSSLSVIENVFIGQEVVRNFPLLRIMAWKKMHAATVGLLQQVGAEGIGPKAIAGQLSGGQKQSVALARMLVSNGQLLIFDEPCASLGVSQRARLLDLMRSQCDNGRAVVLISHDVDDVLAIAHRIVVLRKGRLVSDVARDEVDRYGLSLQMAMV